MSESGKREVARAREIVAAYVKEVETTLSDHQLEEEMAARIARSGAARYADGMRRAAEIVAALNVGIATTPEGEAWNGAIRKAVAAVIGEIGERAIRAGATP